MKNNKKEKQVIEQAHTYPVDSHQMGSPMGALPSIRNTVFNAYCDRKEQLKNEGFSFRTSTALLDNIIAKKEPLSFTANKALAQSTTAPTVAYQSAMGKRVNLTPRQLKIILSLAQITDAFRNNNEVASYIINLNRKIEWDEDANISSPIKFTLDLIGFAKSIYGANRIGSRQVEYVKNDLIALSSIRQEFKVTDANKNTYTLNSEVARVKIFQQTNEKDERVCTLANVEIEDIFLYNINSSSGYQLSPNSILSLWNETGVNTELFSTLLFLLIRVRGSIVKNAIAKSDAKRKDMLKSKYPLEEVNAQVESYKEALLNYQESVPSILDRLGQDTYFQVKRGKQYFRNEKFHTDLAQATNSLLSMGVITNFFTSTGTSGEEICNFVLNANWLKEQANRQKALLPPEDARKAITNSSDKKE